MAIRPRTYHGTLIALWCPVALFALFAVVYGALDARNWFLASVFAYVLLTSVSSIIGHLRIVAGRPGAVLICTPCIPPLLFFLLVLWYRGRDLGEFGFGDSLRSVWLAFAFLLANVIVGWRAHRNFRGSS